MNLSGRSDISSTTAAMIAMETTGSILTILTRRTDIMRVTKETVLMNF
jgi:hypothetical protein